uniref:Eukaryotic translation initiation factor 3 subunit J n=1 Tax=Lygus hesperus TaxID=30085 RepID=A0A0A9WGR7_LYGHE
MGGEDADEDVVDSWDQEEEEDEDGNISPPPILAKDSAPSKKNIKKIGDKIEEKEKRRKLLQTGLNYDEMDKEMTAEEKLAEKLKHQKLQEESDLTLAKEVFGVLGTSGLESKEDFDKLKEEILKVVADCSKNTNYVTFTEDMVHSLCIHLSSTDIKKIHTWLGNLHIEKSKLEKGDKSKKSKAKGKAKLKLEGDNDYTTEYTNYAEDFDDFI